MRHAFITEHAQACLGAVPPEANAWNSGGNIFGPISPFDLNKSYALDVVGTDAHVYTDARYCDWGTTVKAKIQGRIHYRADDATKLYVVFSPLLGGVTPTQIGTPSGALAVSALDAVPRTGGASVTFTLSAEASVIVVVTNLGGRPVRVLSPSGPLPPGTHSLLWNGRSDRGTRVPAGKYLVRVEARTSEGALARGAVAVMVRP